MEKSAVILLGKLWKSQQYDISLHYCLYGIFENEVKKRRNHYDFQTCQLKAEINKSLKRGN